MPLGRKDGVICAGSAGRVYMKKQEKIDLIALGIRKAQLLRMYFRYDENYFYYYPNAVNERLILAQEEDDFQLDGYHIRRISDLKKAETGVSMGDASMAARDSSSLIILEDRKSVV